MLKLTDSIEDVIRQINMLDRGSCIRELRAVPHVQLDFTSDFLLAQTIDQLRHLLLAAHQQARRYLA